MNLLSKYIVTLTRLYGVVHKDVVAEIYNEQNDEQITFQEVESCFDASVQEIEKNFTFKEGNYFVHETILAYEDLDATLEKQAGKPRYVPEKDELLNYLDEFYFYKSKAYNKLYDYVLEYLLDGNEERAEAVCEDVEGMIEVNASFLTVMSTFDNLVVEFDNKQQRDKVKRMVRKLQDNVRLWTNQGHTNQELKDLGYSAAINMSHGNQVLSKKLGRNDPCYCGSGKKYKKCCLDKDQKMNARQ